MVSVSKLEINQLKIYICAIFSAVIIGLLFRHAGLSFGILVTPMLALMLYGMFSQIPFRDIMLSIENKRFFIALILTNFIIIPAIIGGVACFIDEPPLQLGVVMVLLTPCIDYVIVFAHLGKGDARLMLAATPVLFVLQMILLPVFLEFFLNAQAANLIKAKPFFEAFVCLILLPLIMALSLQLLSRKINFAKKALTMSAWFPVPCMAATLFIVISSQINMIMDHIETATRVIPFFFIYLCFALVLGWIIGKFFTLKKEQVRTLIFSLGNRNSFVVLPFALAIPGAAGNLVAVAIVTQTIVELMGQMIYIKLVPQIISDKN